MKDIFKKQMDTEIGQVGVRNRIDCRLLRRDMQRTIPTTRIQSLFLLHGLFTHPSCSLWPVI